MTKYTCNEVNDSINPKFGNVYIAEDVDEKVKDYVLFCEEKGIEKFVWLSSGVIVTATIFYINHKLIKHVEEVVFKY